MNKLNSGPGKYIFFGRIGQILAFSGCSTLIYYTVFNRSYIDKFFIYKTHCTDNKNVVFCDEYFRKLMFDVGAKMNIEKDYLEKVVLFHSPMNIPYNGGHLMSKIGFSFLSTNLKSVPSIGLPMSFRYRQFDDTNFENLQINGKLIKVEPDSEEGVSFRNTVLLTEDAKKFVLARQLFYLHSYMEVIGSSTKILAVYITYQIVYFLKRFTRLLSTKTEIFNAPIYIVLGLAGYLMQRELVANYTTKMHFKADKVVSLLAPRFRTGGIEYYMKLIRLNKLHHEWGFAAHYTKLGNDVTGIFNPASNVSNHTRVGKLYHFIKDESSDNTQNLLSGDNS